MKGPAMPNLDRIPNSPPVVVAAVLLSGGGAEAFDLRLADGALLRLSLTRGALTEIAALAASALGQQRN